MKGWRTFALAAALVLLGVVDLLGVVNLSALLSLVLPDDKVGPVVTVLGLVFAILRVLTTGPLGTAAPPPPDDRGGR